MAHGRNLEGHGIFSGVGEGSVKGARPDWAGYLVRLLGSCRAVFHRRAAGFLTVRVHGRAVGEAHTMQYAEKRRVYRSSSLLTARLCIDFGLSRWSMPRGMYYLCRRHRGGRHKVLLRYCNAFHSLVDGSYSQRFDTCPA